MVETIWPELGGKTLQYGGHTWELTGTVDVRNTGELVAADAKRITDVSRSRATLRFGCEEGSPSLNPGNLGEHFDRIERVRRTHHLVVKKDPKIYRYKLLGIDRG